MNKTDYNREYKKVIETLRTRPRLLLHVCCAPCFSAAIATLTQNFAVTVYYYNPNIYPKEEYDKRLSEIKKLVSAVSPETEIIAEPYDRKEYDNAVGEEKGGKECGEKCKRCCTARLERTARKAKEGGYDYFTTTLTSSPLKDAEYLNKEMARLSDKYGVKYLPSDFKKEGGNIRIKETCEKYGIYRQHYCGCTPPRIIVAVTGGIASGKSSFVGMLEEFGAYTIDADKVTRKLQEEGSEVNAAIKQAFPDAVRNGALDRQALKREVFGNPEKLKTLESIVHPAVADALKRLIRRADAKVIVLEVPLLYESGLGDIADVRVNVSASYEIRERRAIARDGINSETFASIVARQLSDEERSLRSDITVVNDGDSELLSRQAKELMTQWLNRLK